jgi:hypothetical protein
MATVGDLVVNLSTNSKGFTKGMQGATKQVTTFGSVVEKTVKVGAVAAMAAAAGAVAMVVSQMKSLDELAKASRRTGFGAEAIAGLGFAAEQSGADVATLNKALEKFTKNLGDAALTDTGTAKMALEEMGIAISDLIAIKPEEQLSIVADAIADLGTKAEKASALTALFGRAGGQLLPMFEDGAAGLQKFTDEAEELGLAFSADELQSIEDANDSINRLTRRISALASVFTVKIAPAIEIVVSALESLQVTADSVIDKLGGGLQGALNAISPQAGAVFGVASAGLKAKSGQMAAERALKNQRFPAGTDFSIPKDNKAEEKEANAILKEIRDQQKNNPGLFISLQGGV